MMMLRTHPIAANEVRIKGSHLIGWGFVLPSFLPSCHFLNSSTFNTIRIMDASIKRTWKNLIITGNFITCEDKVLPSFPERGQEKVVGQFQNIYI
jgi:hypothetical protein